MQSGELESGMPDEDEQDCIVTWFLLNPITYPILYKPVPQVNSKVQQAYQHQ